MQVQKQQLESEMEQYRLVPNWERSTIRLYIVCLFNLYAEYIMQNARLDESQAEQDCWEKYQQHQVCR